MVRIEGFRIQDLGFRVTWSGFKGYGLMSTWSLVFGVRSLEFTVEGFKVEGSEFRFQG